MASYLGSFLAVGDFFRGEIPGLQVVRFSGGGVLFRWGAFPLERGAAEIFRGGRFFEGASIAV